MFDSALPCALHARVSRASLHRRMQLRRPVAPPRATGDAVRRALTALPAEGVTMVLIGDAPLVPPAALVRLAAAASQQRLALLTAKVDDPSGLGRIVRDPYGHVRAIVEQRDAT